ncbi:MAG: methylmalonyl Co-A mutase-associated GTPase MeaB [Gemmatimonadales bacterium]
MALPNRMCASTLLDGIRDRNVAALAKAVTLVENGGDGFEQLLSAIHPHVGRAHRIGLTGPPGAGKSTLVEQLVRQFRERGETVAVVAVDPTSPFSGGALLGDRIRMESVVLDPGVYIRSMAARGATGGLAMSSREVCDVLDAFGFDRILIETVGVGQSELAIAGSADTAVLILVPESGDGVQMLKAGVMEIADLYVVNKADRPGADRLVQEIMMMLGLKGAVPVSEAVAGHHGAVAATVRGGEVAENEWAPPALATSAVNGVGIGELVAALGAHRAYLKESGELKRRRRERLKEHTRDVVDRALNTLVWYEGRGEEILEGGMDSVVRGTASPYKLAEQIVAALREGGVDRGD